MTPSSNRPGRHISLVLPGLAAGGTERTILTVARGLLASGHKVDIVLFEPEFAYAGDVPAEARLFVLSDRVATPPELPVDPEWQPEYGSLLQGLRLLTRLIRELGQPRTVLNGRPLSRALRLHRYVQREKPDILFANLPAAELPALYATRIGRAFPPVVPVVHGAVRPRQTLRRQLFFPTAAHVVAVSRGLAYGIADATDMPQDRLSVVFNPTDIERVRKLARETPDHLWFGDGGPPVVLSAGRLSREKDFLTLIEAFHRVLPQYPCRLVVLGEGPMRAELEDRVHELGLEEHVSFPGWVDNPFAFMSRASLFVLSSLHEGLGNVLVEAMVCGCPAISTDCPGGVSEVLQDPALLAPVGDRGALALLMLRSLDRRVDRAELRAKTERFSMERAMQGYEAVIAAAMESRTPPGGRS